MSNFNLDDYVPVNDRIALFYKKYPDGRLQTDVIVDDGTRLVIKAKAFRDSTDQVPTTGHAEEVRGEGYINKTSAVENCETSAIGRALANMGFAIDKGIASREEMQKVKRMEDPAWIKEKSVAQLKTEIKTIENRINDVGDFICDNCHKVIEPHGNFSARQIADFSKTAFGEQLCWDDQQIHKIAQDRPLAHKQA